MRYPSPSHEDSTPFAPPPQLPDPHGMAVKHMHLKFNVWEVEQLARIARRDCVPMTTLVRRLVRAHLFAEQKR